MFSDESNSIYSKIEFYVLSEKKKLIALFLGIKRIYEYRSHQVLRQIAVWMATISLNNRYTEMCLSHYEFVDEV